MKQVGDEIAVGDELVEIETDKANMAYETDVAGTLTEILAEEGETLPIGEPIARVGELRMSGSSRTAAGPVAGGRPLRCSAPEAPPAAELPRHHAPTRRPRRASRGAGIRSWCRRADGERIKASPVARADR